MSSASPEAGQIWRHRDGKFRVVRVGPLLVLVEWVSGLKKGMTENFLPKQFKELEQV